MQNRYTGDLGDFGKYGLLRALTRTEEKGPSPIRLGVVWYLTPDEENNQDGRQTRYLEPDNRRSKTFTECDEELYQALRSIVRDENRRVGAIQDHQLLPQETVYHEDLLNLRRMRRRGERKVRQLREEAREEWNAQALDRTQECGVVFLDPDNGLETGKVDAASSRGAKYAYYEELKPYLERGQSLVIYHHLNRGSKSLQQISRKQREIYEKLGMRAFALRYHRGSPRAFIVIPNREHREEIVQRTRDILRSPWKQHFSMVG